MKVASSVINAIKYCLRNKPVKYANKQLDDVLKYGKAKQYSNVSDEILEKYTPFRRLSKKRCTLSDNDYFIQKFEKEYSLEIPELWGKMSDAKKIDFIVKNRYERLLSNKIMNSIKDCGAEQSFILSTDGKIKYYGTLNSSKHCPVPRDLAKNSVKIHNHPIQFTKCDGYWGYDDLAQVNANSRPFSYSDIINSISDGAKKAYVVDSKGIKFQFIPNKKTSNFALECLRDDLGYIQQRAFTGNRSIEEAFRKNYIETAKRIKQDGHDFRILNFWDFDKF